MLYVNPLESSARSGVTLDEAHKSTMAFKELEQLFIYNLLEEMRKTVPRDDLFGDSQARQVFEGYMDETVSKAWSESGQLGIADMMEREYMANQRAQEVRAAVLSKDSVPFADKGM